MELREGDSVAQRLHTSELLPEVVAHFGVLVRPGPEKTHYKIAADLDATSSKTAFRH